LKRVVRMAVAMVAASAASAGARPLPEGMTATVTNGNPYVARDGTSVRLGAFDFAKDAASSLAIELSDDGAAVVVHYRSCRGEALEDREPLATVEARLANVAGMAHQLKRDHAAAIPDFAAAVAKNPELPVYATNLLSAQSRAGKLDAADRTLATEGARAPAWFAWRLAVDPDLARLRSRASAAPFAKLPPRGHATVKEPRRFSYSPFGGGLVAGVFGELVVADAATGREMFRLPLTSRAEAGVIDSALATLGFEPMPDVHEDAGRAKSPDGAVTIDLSDTRLPIVGYGNDRIAVPVDHPVVAMGVVPGALVLQVKTEHTCTGIELPQLLKLVPLKGYAPAASKPVVDLCAELRRKRHAKSSACIAGDFGAPGAFLWTRGYGDKTWGDDRWEVVRADGTVIAAAPNDYAAVNPEDSDPGLELADLDGDGTPEVIVDFPTARHAIGDRLEVLHLAGKRLEPVEGTWVSLDNSGFDHDPPTICEGTTSIAPAAHGVRLVVTMTKVRDPDHRCLARGKHAFELRAGKLVEVTS
jgi:hypothetical protein